MIRLTGGEVLKRCLVEEGVRYIFGVPGDQLYPILDAIYQDKRIEFITMRHEAGAAHAADAWARVTGEPGVCLGTVGPGAANLIGGTYAAYADSIPMLVITAQNQSWRSYPDHGSTQGLDQLSLFKAVTKWNSVVSHWRRIPELAQCAFRLARSGRPGPVHLDFPADVLYQTGEDSDIRILHPSSYRAIERPVGNASLLDQAARMLVDAKSPLIHAGGGVLRSGASKELIELADYLQAPVTTSPTGRGAIPEDHPLCLIPACPGSGALVAQVEADVVLLVGGRLGDLEMWGQPPLAWGDPAQQKLKLPLTFVVANDSAWGMIRSGQTLAYSRRHIGVDLSDIRYDRIAQAMNCYGERIAEPSEIRPALQRAVESKLPSVLDVVVDRESVPPDFQTLASVWLEGCELP
jgi:acetolactate synthase-1/2/3 large subunit